MAWCLSPMAASMASVPSDGIGSVQGWVWGSGALWLLCAGMGWYSKRSRVERGLVRWGLISISMEERWWIGEGVYAGLQTCWTILKRSVDGLRGGVVVGCGCRWFGVVDE